MIKIGITERGDIAFDDGWIEPLRNNKVAAAILISKGLPTEKGKKAMAEMKYRIIFHATTTGYGGTIIEPNVKNYEIRLQELYNFCKKIDFPFQNVVIRVDPIIPTEKGITLAKEVIALGIWYGFRRYRFSFIDVYNHVKRRFLEQHIKIPPTIQEADPLIIKNLYDSFNDYKEIFKKRGKDIYFESCAENNEYAIGCISKRDFEILGLSPDLAMGKSAQRKTCLCCSNKTELLTRKNRCPHQCLYCYWVDGR